MNPFRMLSIALCGTALLSACDGKVQSGALPADIVTDTSAVTNKTPEEEKQKQVEIVKETVTQSGGLTDEEKALINSLLDKMATQPDDGSPSSEESPPVKSAAQQSADLIAGLSELLGNGSTLRDPSQSVVLLLSASARLMEKIGNDMQIWEAPEAEILEAQKIVLSEAARHLLNHGVPAKSILLIAARELAKIPESTVAGVQSLVDIPELEDLSSADRSASLTEGVAALRQCLEVTQVLKNVLFYCPDGTTRTGTFDPNSTSDIDSGVILVGETVKGVAGTYEPDFPSVANVRVSDSVDGQSGTLADCAADGQVGCVTTTSYRAAAVSGIAAKILAGEVIAGETGLIELPSPAEVLSGATFGAGGGIAGTLNLPDPSEVQSGVDYGASNSLTGTYNPPLPGFPNLSNVRSADPTYPGTLADCVSDGDDDCYVPPSTPLKVADTSQFSSWDIRRKRNPSTGALLTFAGIGGQLKFCKERANLSAYDNSAAGMGAASSVIDLVDVMDNWNNAGGLPTQIPPWRIISSTNYSTDKICGGIYATGTVTTGPTGADPALAHDPAGNWQDLTPGILPGGAASTNPINGCNATDKLCVFRELNSGLMITQLHPATAANVTWEQAWGHCDTLGNTNPIPTIGGQSYSDWRLPSLHEVRFLNDAGLYGLNATASLVSNFGDVDWRDGSNHATAYWTLTTASDLTTHAWALVNKGRDSNYHNSRATEWAFPKTAAGGTSATWFAPGLGGGYAFMRHFCVRESDL